MSRGPALYVGDVEMRNRRSGCNSSSTSKQARIWPHDVLRRFYGICQADKNNENEKEKESSTPKNLRKWPFGKTRTIKNVTHVKRKDKKENKLEITKQICRFLLSSQEYGAFVAIVWILCGLHRDSSTFRTVFVQWKTVENEKNRKSRKPEHH